MYLEPALCCLDVVVSFCVPRCRSQSPARLLLLLMYSEPVEMPTTTSRSEHARQDDYTASVVAAEPQRLIIMASPRRRIPTTQHPDGETACVMAGLGVVVNLNESPFSASRGNTFAVQCLKKAAGYGGNEAERTRSTGEISHHR